MGRHCCRRVLSIRGREVSFYLDFTHAKFLLPMRLNRYLSACGLGSRRGCESLVREGRVSINGKLVQDLARRVEEGDKVVVDGSVAKLSPPQTIAFYKPKGLVTTQQDELGRDTIYNALPPQLQDLKYVGRLDQDSEGLLILTRDGHLAHELTHPKSEVEKEYLVTLDQAFDRTHLPRLLRGIQLEEGFAKAKSVKTTTPRRLKVVLTQGMKRQIRRMFESMGYRVKKLIRVRIGSLLVEGLDEGKWHILGETELGALKRNPELLKEAPKEAKAPARDSRQLSKEDKIAADKAWKKTRSSSQLQKRRRKKEEEKKKKTNKRGFQSKGRPSNSSRNKPGSKRKSGPGKDSRRHRS